MQKFKCSSSIWKIKAVWARLGGYLSVSEKQVWWWSHCPAVTWDGPIGDALPCNYAAFNVLFPYGSPVFHIELDVLRLSLSLSLSVLLGVEVFSGANGIPCDTKH